MNLKRPNTSFFSSKLKQLEIDNRKYMESLNQINTKKELNYIQNLFIENVVQLENKINISKNTEIKNRADFNFSEIIEKENDCLLKNMVDVNNFIISKIQTKNELKNFLNQIDLKCLSNDICDKDIISKIILIFTTKFNLINNENFLMLGKILISNIYLMEKNFKESTTNLINSNKKLRKIISNNQRLDSYKYSDPYFEKTNFKSQVSINNKDKYLPDLNENKIKKFETDFNNNNFHKNFKSEYIPNSKIQYRSSSKNFNNPNIPTHLNDITKSIENNSSKDILTQSCNKVNSLKNDSNSSIPINCKSKKIKKTKSKTEKKDDEEFVPKQFKNPKMKTKRKIKWTIKKGLFCWEGKKNYECVKEELIQNISKAVKNKFKKIKDERFILKLDIKKFSKNENERNLSVFRIYVNDVYLKEIQKIWLKNSENFYIKTKIDLLKNNKILFKSDNDQIEEFSIDKLSEFASRYNFSQAHYYTDSSVFNVRLLNQLILERLNV